jgi:hypothetical protein
MKRQRYTATFPNGTRKVVLAYNEAEVYIHFGWGVTGVEKGDYRLHAAAGSSDFRPAWKPDWPAIERAIEHFGLSERVQIRLTHHKSGRFGAYQLRPVGSELVHHITVKNWLSPEQASRTLWHELTHAMQAERAMRAADAADRRAKLLAWRAANERGRGVTYMRKPVEVEARANEPLAISFPLAKSL